MTKKLYRSSTDKLLTGVCGGIAEYLDIDATVLRLIWTLVVVFTGFVPGVLVYIIAVLVMPERPGVVHEPAASTATESPIAE